MLRPPPRSFFPKHQGDRLSFQEFIFAFAQWLGLLEDDEDYGTKDDSNRYKHSSPSAATARKAPAVAAGDSVGNGGGSGRAGAGAGDASHGRR